MTSRTHQIYNIIFEHGFDPPPPPVWTMFKKTALFWKGGIPKWQSKVKCYFLDIIMLWKKTFCSDFYCAYSTFASEVMKHCCCRPVPIRRFLVLAPPTRQKVLSGLREEKGALLHPALDPTGRIISIFINIITILVISIINVLWTLPVPSWLSSWSPSLPTCSGN